MADSDRDWRRWAETEPYFGVLADPRFRMAAIGDNREEFFRLGRLQVEERLAAAERLFGPLGRRRALDFGCGVGRLTLPLAAHFDQVLGLDIAPAMLTEARANADSAGVANLRLAPSDDDLTQAQGPFDFIMSCLVLQHIPVRRGLRIIGRLLDRAAPGGVVSLQLCVGRTDDRAGRLRYWAQSSLPGVHALFNWSRGRPVREPFMEMNAYPLDRVRALAQAAGFGPLHVEAYADGRFQCAQLLMRREP